MYSRAYRRNECPDGIELIWGDLERPSSITASIEHSDAVIHCAWDPRQDPPDRYTQNNVDGTVDLLRSAISAGVPRFIHISSVAVYGSVPRSDGRAFDEESETIAEDDALDVYPRTKALLERRLRDVAQEGATPSCVSCGRVCCTDMEGPLRSGSSPWEVGRMPSCSVIPRTIFLTFMSTTWRRWWCVVSIPIRRRS